MITSRCAFRPVFGAMQICIFVFLVCDQKTSHAEDNSPYPLRLDLPDAVVAPGSTDQALLSEKNAIRETVARVFLAMDANSLTVLERLVTDNVVVNHSIFGSMIGRESFVRSVRDFPSAFDRYRHISLNTVTTVHTASTASALSYIMVVQAHPDEAGRAEFLPMIVGIGVVQDDLIKEDNLWRISHRTYDQFGLNETVFADESLRIQAASSLLRSPTRSSAE